MNKNINKFIGLLRPIKNSLVKGYGVMIKVRGDVIVKMKIEDDDGEIYFIVIHNVNYIPEYPICLISTH